MRAERLGSTPVAPGAAPDELADIEEPPKPHRVLQRIEGQRESSAQFRLVLVTQLAGELATEVVLAGPFPN